MLTIVLNLVPQGLVSIFWCMVVTQSSSIDVEFGVRTPDMGASTTKNSVQKLKSRLDRVYKKTHEIKPKESECNKKWYDCNISCTQVKPDDLTLSRQKASKDKQKIKDIWENIHYKIVEKVTPDLQIFKYSNRVNLLNNELYIITWLFHLFAEQGNDEKGIVPDDITDKEVDSISNTESDRS